MGFYVSEGAYGSAQSHPYVDLFVAAKNLIYGSVFLFAGIVGLIVYFKKRKRNKV